MLFLDDGWCVNATFELVLKDSRFVFSTLEKAGLVVNIDRSVFKPVQCLEWLGFLWDLKNGIFLIPERRISNVRSFIDKILAEFPVCTARKLAQLAGKIISMSPVLGNVCLFQTKGFFWLIETRLSWDNRLYIQDLYDNLMFWHSVFSSEFHKRLFNDFLPTVLVYSDASAIAGAAYIDCEGAVAHKTWSVEEKLQSSTFRELLAIHFSLYSFRKKLSGKRVIWNTDSKNCVQIIEKGSMKKDLNGMALDIGSVCASYCISLEPHWIKRENNVLADDLSRIVDYDDYGVSDDFFHYIDTLYGPHSVDRFANEQNKKLARYNSMFWTPDTEAVDSFSVHWGGENNWLVPPICLLLRTLNFLLFCKAAGTVVAPHWPSSPFFPLLFAESSLFAPYIVEVLVFKEPSKIYVQGQFKGSIFGSERFSSKVMVIRLDCRDLTV